MLAPNQKRQQPPRLLATTNQEIWSRFDLSRRACPAGAGTPFLLPLLLFWSAASPRRLDMSRSDAVSSAVAAFAVSPLSRHKSVLLLAYYKAATADGLPSSSSLRDV